MLARRRFAACALCAAAGLVASKVEAAGVTRTVLSRTDYPGATHAIIQVLIEVEPDAVIPRHTHPGVETIYVLEGESSLSVQGQPDRKVGAADSIQIPPLVPHGLRNGPGRTRAVAVYVVEKDKPLISLAPE